MQNDIHNVVKAQVGIMYHVYLAKAGSSVFELVRSRSGLSF